MASTLNQVARIQASLDVLISRLRDVVQVRADAVTMGGTAFVQPALDIVPPATEDPVPDLSASQLGSALQAVAAINTLLAANSALHRKAILARTFTPEIAVAKSRQSIRTFRDALSDLRQLKADLTDSANGTAMLTFLTDAVGAEVAAQVIAELDAITAIDATLDDGTGTLRKALTLAAD